MAVTPLADKYYSMYSKRSAFLFIAFFLLAMWFVDGSWDGKVFVYMGEYRAPAAVRALSDYSPMDRRSLNRSAHTQLLESATVIKDKSQLGLRLGHPILRRESGGRVFGCDVPDHGGAFDRIELQFYGEGVLSGGLPPRMTVVSPCHSLHALDQLETIWIPMHEIYSRPAKDQEFRTFGENAVDVRLADIPPEWPEHWVLMGVRMFRESSPDQSLSMDVRLLREARPGLLSLEWTDSK